MERLFSIPESARALGGVSVWTVRAWLSQRRLRRTKVGRRTMISEGELEKFISNDGNSAAISPSEKGVQPPHTLGKRPDEMDDGGRARGASWQRLRRRT